MSYFESLLAKRSRGVRDMLQKSLFSSKKILSKVQTLGLHETTGWEEVKLFPW